MFSVRNMGRYVALIGLVVGVVAACLAPTLTLSARPPYQATTVTITSQNVTCSGITVNYTVSGSFPEAFASLTAHSNTGTLGSATGPGDSGNQTVFIPVAPPQPTYTPMYAVVTVLGVSAQGSPMPCVGGESGSSSPGGNSGGNPPASWPGYSDGRLNPVPDEYYSVWCGENNVIVYGGVPQPEFLQAISLRKIYDMGNSSFRAGTGNKLVTVTRNGDQVTISGNNGNRAPTAGSKSFSLADCIQHNHGVPPALPSIAVNPPTDDCQAAPNSGIKDRSAECDFAEIVTIFAGICLPKQAIAAGFVMMSPAILFRRRRKLVRKKDEK